jgi:DNA helicase IV
LRERTAGSLEAVRRAPVVPTPAGRAERDAFDALHTERLRQLRAVEDRLVFGRLDLLDPDHHRPRYVGRIGLSDDERHQLLLDWRAPAAAAFYQATAAAPLGVVRRRHIALRGRTVSSLDDEVLDVDALARATASGHADLATVTGDGALMTALTAHRTGRMRDIVQTLQAEQDRVVRSELPGVLVVQGGPGTGKTAVALHRAAYLLYTHRERIARSGVLVVGPTPVFLRYIEQVLPSLGETGVVLATAGQLFPGVEATAHDRPEVAALKGDPKMAGVIKAAVRRRERLLAEPVGLMLDGDQVVLTPRLISHARARARQSGRPHNDARVTFVRIVLDDLADQLADRRRMQRQDDERSALLAELRDSREVRREVNLLWMPLSAQGLVSDLLTKPAKLAEAAGGVIGPAQQKLLLREPGSPWTLSDVPLLDEAAELIGADVEALSADRVATSRAAAERAEALRFARRVLRESGEAAAMMTPEMLVDRFAGSGPIRSVAERAREDRAWTFGHAVIDEAQELSPMQWRLIARRVPNRSMTVVGDVAQTGSVAGTTSWAAVLDPLVGGRWRLEELTVNYRTPASVMALADALLQAAGIETARARTAREGEHAPIGIRLAGRDVATVTQAVTAAVRADDAALDGGRFGVIASRALIPDLVKAVTEALGALPNGIRPPDGAEPLRERVEVLSVDDVKGLEFDGVVVVDPTAIAAESPRGVNDLYVALTRPTQRLTVLHHGRLPTGLTSLSPAD